MIARIKYFGFIIFIIILCPGFSLAQDQSLRTKISKIADKAKGHVGVAIEDLVTSDTMSINNEYHYPMQSVFKFPLALAVLNEVDKGKLSLNQKIHLDKENLHRNTWSPLREKYPKGNVNIALSEILNYTVSESDNNGCDILLDLIGGPAKVNRYIHNLGIREISIAVNEEEMHKDWSIQYKNWTTPMAMVNLLSKFSRDSILSAKSKDYLWNVMVSTVTGADRIKGKLPAGTIVAHKTGSSGANKNGISAATNDVGIVTLPNGRCYAIAVLISNSSADDNVRNNVIADISKAVWDYFTAN